MDIIFNLYFILFILDRLLPENEPEPQIYNLIKKFMIDLSNKNDFTGQNLSVYVNKILIYLGYNEENLALSDAVRMIEELIGEKIPFFII